MGRGGQTITLRTQEIRMKFLVLLISTLCLSIKSIKSPVCCPGCWNNFRSPRCKEVFNQVPAGCWNNFRSPRCKAFWLSAAALNFCTKLIASADDLNEKTKICCYHPSFNSKPTIKQKCCKLHVYVTCKL